MKSAQFATLLLIRTIFFGRLAKLRSSGELPVCVARGGVGCYSLPPFRQRKDSLQTREVFATTTTASMTICKKVVDDWDAGEGDGEQNTLRIHAVVEGGLEGSVCVWGAGGRHSFLSTSTPSIPCNRNPTPRFLIVLLWTVTLQAFGVPRITQTCRMENVARYYNPCINDST